MFQILIALCDGERHGYGIMQEVSRTSGGRVRVSPGTLYRSIKVLLDAGLIAESEERPDPTLDDERRRYYGITAPGRQAAEAEAHRLEELVSMAREKRLLSPGTTALGDGGA